MTVIAAKKDKGIITIAADSQVTWTGGGKTYVKKLFIKNNVIYGMSGVAADLSLLRSYLSEKQITSHKEKHIVDFISAFASYAKMKNPDCKPLDNHYLICINGKIITASGLFIEYHKQFSAIGSGKECALVALDLGATAKHACEITCKYQNTCGGKIHSLILKGKKI